MGYKVLICDAVAKKGLEFLKTKGFECLEFTGKTEDEITAVAGEYDAIIVRSATKITPKILKAGVPRLKIVGRAGVGYDNINVDAASENGVLVMNSPFGTTVSVAELAFGMALAIARKLSAADAKMKQSVWDKKSFMGHEINGRTAGIVGAGRIGMETAKRFAAFGLKILCYDPFAKAEAIKALGYELVTLDRLLAESDIISLHIPKTKETAGMLNKEAFAKMRDNVILVNCARGGVVNEADLLETLRTNPKKFMGVALDVFESEPPVNWELAKHELVLATPHIGASTKEGQELCARQICEQIVAFFTENKVINGVNADKLKK